MSRIKVNIILSENSKKWKLKQLKCTKVYNYERSQF